MELAERHLCVQERCLKVLAVNHEVVRQEQLLRRRLEVVCVMVERSLEVHSSLSSSAAMDSPHAGTIPARSGSTHRAGRSMHGIHRGTMVGA